MQASPIHASTESWKAMAGQDKKTNLRNNIIIQRKWKTGCEDS